MAKPINFAIIISVKDPAGINIKKQLLSRHSFVQLHDFFGVDHVYSKSIENSEARIYTAPIESINNENIDEEIYRAGKEGFVPDLIIFATKHESKSGINSLSCHSPGNWASAEYGGLPKKLCMAPAFYLKQAFILLNTLGREFADKNRFDIVMECTHHGPYVKTPILFIEIGSCETAWKNTGAAELISDVIIKLVSEPSTPSGPGSNKYKPAVGLGGMHTCSSFTKVQLGQEFALGHICPKYCLQELDVEMLIAALDTTIPAASTILLDWKGLGQHKEKVMVVVEELSKSRNLIVLKTHGI